MVLARVVHQLVRTMVLIERGIELMMRGRIPQVLLHSIVEDVLGSQGVRMGHAIMDRPRVKRVVLGATEVLDAAHMLGTAKMLNMAATAEPAELSPPKMAPTDVAACSSMAAAAKMANAHMTATHVAATTTHVPPAAHVPATTHVAATAASVTMTGVQSRNDCERNADADGNRNARRADHGSKLRSERGHLKFERHPLYPHQISGGI